MRRYFGISNIPNRRLIRFVGLLGLGVLLLGGGLYAIGSRIEAMDSFCASCHIEPEQTYYEASLLPGEARTLAAYHAGAQTRCIDCHSRKGLPGRVWAQIGGLSNWVSYLSGNFRSPSVTTRPVGDSGCSKCHRDLRWVSERPGHYHSPLLRQEWQRSGGPANTCESCHPSHEMIASAEDRFTNTDQIEPQCDDCHESTGVTNGSISR